MFGCFLQGTGNRLDRRAYHADQEAHRAAVQDLARPAGETTRLAGIENPDQANGFLELTFLVLWDKRFVRLSRQTGGARRQLERAHRIEQILGVREEHIWWGRNTSDPRCYSKDCFTLDVLSHRIMSQS
jgi:hypothetical protein